MESQWDKGWYSQPLVISSWIIRVHNGRERLRNGRKKLKSGRKEMRSKWKKKRGFNWNSLRSVINFAKKSRKSCEEKLSLRLIYMQ